MVITYMKAQRCPMCGNVLDYFNSFSTSGKICRLCGWKEEVYTGLSAWLQEQKDRDDASERHADERKD